MPDVRIQKTRSKNKIQVNYDIDFDSGADIHSTLQWRKFPAEVLDAIDAVWAKHFPNDLVLIDKATDEQGVEQFAKVVGALQDLLGVAKDGGFAK